MASTLISCSYCSLFFSPEKGLVLSDGLKVPVPDILKLHWSYSPITPAPTLKMADLTFSACPVGQKVTSFFKNPFLGLKTLQFFSPSFCAILWFTPFQTLSMLVCAA